MRKSFVSMQHGQWKRSFFTFLSMVLLTSSALFAQSKDSKGPPKPQELTLTSQGGWPIAITYYESSNAADAPVVVLLHGKGGNKRVWDNKFGSVLQQNGYAVIAVDLRKHGKSQPNVPGATGNQNQKGSSRAANLSALDYKAMVVLDMETIWKFLFEEHQKKHLNMQKTAIIAADMSVPIALNYALLDWGKVPYDDAPVLAAKTPKGQTIRALVLISPESKVKGLTSSQPAVKLKEPLFGISFFVCSSSGDSYDRNYTEKLFSLLTSATNSKGRMFKETYPGKLRGTDMLGKRLGLEVDILKFLEAYLKKLPGDWSDRRPRYDREE
ncbi:alpha/beta hydrolase [Gimesia panareensis]|uniref:Alpha/beta hydrolase family protein n=1 Tax=Gimesia panareensis TaxID=2527978 RepID=A0A518A8K1_9PLAN|nr:alpha/beta fold hydrolase [Gimesia panareensis]QDT28193.1 Alpha/beta hydrolase family protein [Gimesia panareensis]QDU51060.1 Alpha/beta hydrolase family protein [Gimesia panareensis]